MNFLSLALNGKKIGFGKIIKMIDDLTVELKKEAQDDLDKKEYCEREFDIADDKKKSQIRDIASLETSIQDAKETISTLVGEIDALGDGIKALDKQVTEATEQRKEEASDYTTNLANNAAAVELLGFAKNRLNKFYNPKLYKEPPAEFVQADPGPAPEAPKAYSKKSEESTGVIAMIDTLVRDVEKEMTEAEFTEKDAQGDYETFMSDSSAKRTEDSKSLTDKEATLSEVKTNLLDDTETKKTTEGELMATDQYIMNLHADCDFLMKYFDVRAEARNGEIDAMSKCKAVLSGADYSLIQTHVKRSLRGL
jgi:FtsZ-binding cell division protein ZapB